MIGLKFKGYCKACPHSALTDSAGYRYYYCGYEVDRNKLSSANLVFIVWFENGHANYKSYKKEQDCPMYLEYLVGATDVK